MDFASHHAAHTRVENLQLPLWMDGFCDEKEMKSVIAGYVQNSETLLFLKIIIELWNQSDKRLN